MRWRPLFTDRNTVLAASAAIVAALLWVCAMFALDAQERREAAERILDGAEVEDSLHSAVHAWAEERGRVHAALHAAEAATPETRAAIGAARGRGDAAIEAALERLRLRRNGGRRDELVAQAEHRLTEVRALRRRIDEQLDLPAAAREGPFREAWFPAVTELIMAAERLSGAIHAGRRSALPEVDALGDVRHAGWVMSEFTEREVALIAGTIAAREPLVLGDLMQFPAYRGRVDQAWAIVEAYAREPFAAPQVVAALEDVRRGYFDAYARLRRPVVAAGMEGTDYPLGAAAWLGRSGEAIEPIRALGAVAAAATRRLASAERGNGLVQLVLALAAAAATLAVGTVATWLVLNRVVRPISRITSAMRALARGDQTGGIAAENGYGEMSEMAHAVEVVKDSLEAKSREVFEANEALRRLSEVLSAESERLFARLGEAAAFARNGAAALDRGRILLVAGEGESRDLLAGRLASRGYHVAVAADGAEAMRTLDTLRPDLVLLEPARGGADGVPMLSRLDSEPGLADVPVLVLSDGAPDDEAWRCIEAGADDYVPARAAPVLMTSRIEACLERKRRRDHGDALMARLEAEKQRFDELVLNLLSRQRPRAQHDAPRMPPPKLLNELSETDVKLKRELEAVLAEADERRARNGRLTTRNLAAIMESSGRYRFKGQTLRKIIDRRYPPLYRLGILGLPQNH